MSLFGAMMGDLDEDPFFGGQIRRMNQMMNSMFRDPFGDMFGDRMFGGPALMLPGPQQVQPHRQRPHADYGPGALMSFGGFPNLRHVFDMTNAGGGAQFSSMQVMSMTQGPDGRPQVYQASSSTRQGPNGIRETKKTVADSRTGLKKMSVGHHIHDRAHIVEREQNVYSGEQEERQEFINLEEEEADTFNKEWMEKTRGMRRNEAIGYGNRARHGGRDNRNGEMLALPPAQSSTSSSGRVPPRAMPRRRIQSSCTEPKSKAASIAENKGDEKGKKRPVIVEIDSDTEEPQTKHSRRSSEDEVTITEVTSDSDDDSPQN